METAPRRGFFIILYGADAIPAHFAGRRGKNAANPAFFAGIFFGVAKRAVENKKIA
ncbi:MAG: hypothetical protein IJU41_05040 [Clostridia bacterium]|nr:hypothetical protein [Clostridia bacterium]